MTRRDPTTLKEFFASGQVPTGAHFTDLIESVISSNTPVTLTISSGAVTRSQFLHRVDTEGEVASDTLETINGTGDGLLLILMLHDSGRTVTVAETGNIDLTGGTTYSMSGYDKVLFLIYNSDHSKWIELLRT